MAAVLLWILSVWVFGLVSAQDQTITAEPGDVVTFICDAVRYKPINVVDWSKIVQNQQKVFLFQNGQPNFHVLEQSYEGRVELKGKENGNMSLILKNVTTADSGTYRCHIQSGTNLRQRRADEVHLISTIDLQVSPRGDKRGQTGGGQDGTSSGPSGLVVTLIVLTVIVVLMIPVVIIIIVKRRLPHHPPHNEKKPPLLPNIHFSYKEALKHACPLSVAT